MTAPQPPSPHAADGPSPAFDPGAEAASPYQAPPQDSPYRAPAQEMPHPAPVPVAAPGTDAASDLGAALKFAGNALLRNPAAYLVSSGVYFAVLVLISIIAVVVPMVFLVGMLVETTNPESAAVGALLIFYAAVLVLMLPLAPLMWLWQTGAARAAAVVADGGRPTIGQAFVGPWRILLTVILVSAITFVGALLFYIPGLIAAVLLYYALPAAARGASPVEAVKESFEMVRANLGATLLAWLVVGAISSVASLFVLPVLLVIPFSLLLQLGMYERLKGRELVEPAQA